MSIRIIKPGIYSSLQDKGRYGYQHLGISPCGAMDIFAARIANYIVGNCSNETVLEFHFPAPQILFEEDALIALGGADFDAMINDQKIPINTPVIVSKLTVLQFTKPFSGARSYLSVQGGFALEPWFNSNSTDTRLQKGGHKRILQKDDIIQFKKSVCFTRVLKEQDCFCLHCCVDVSTFYSSNNIIRFVEGIEFSILKEESKNKLQKIEFEISPQSNRMGYRLNGIALEKENQLELISSAVTKGSLQLLPNGQLIVLMADHQTTGGYPRIGHIISADISKLAQLKAGEGFYLEKISIKTAHQILAETEKGLHQIQTACSFKLKEFLSSHS